MAHNVRLVFSNADATPKNVAIDLDIDSANDVCVWYAAFHAGDRFTLTMNGRNVPLDHNGEPVWPT